MSDAVSGCIPFAGAFLMGVHSLWGCIPYGYGATIHRIRLKDGLWAMGVASRDVFGIFVFK